jgi:isopentenyldiphosphate isomerase
MEIVDIVDQNDRVIGTASREDCHNNPVLIHRTVHFTLFDRLKGNILLTQRSYKKQTDAGKYCFLGEHVLSGETYEKALLRGVKEELGLNLNEFVFLKHTFFKYDNQSEFCKFFIIYWHSEPIIYDKNELEQTIWISLEKMKEPVYDYSLLASFWINNIDWALLS